MPRQNNKTVLLAVDEFENVYTNKQVWREFSMLASKFTQTLCLADSGSKVRAMVERKGHEPQLQRWFPSVANELPGSLNQDRMAVRELRPFTTREQYRTFFKGRSVPLRRSIPRGDRLTTGLLSKDVMPHDEAVPSDDVIDAIHHLSGGRLRVMQRNDGPQPLLVLPPSDSAEFFVLNELARKQATQPWSTFNTVEATEDEVLGWIQTWRSNQQQAAKESATDVSSRLDGNFLVTTARGLLTFGAPDYYRLVRDVRPKVFFSHAWNDRDHPTIRALVDELLRRQVHVVLDTDPVVQRSMAEYKLVDWMRDQARANTNHYVVAMLSPAYMQRASVKDSGVDIDLNEMAGSAPAASRSVLAVALNGKYDEEWAQQDRRVAAVAARRVYLIGSHDTVQSLVGHICGHAATTAAAEAKVSADNAGRRSVLGYLRSLASWTASTW